MSNDKRPYQEQRFTQSVYSPRGMWKEVKDKVQKEVNFKTNVTQTLIYVFLNFLEKSINDYDIETMQEPKRIKGEKND